MKLTNKKPRSWTPFSKERTAVIPPQKNAGSSGNVIRRRRALTAERIASQKLQGEYLGYLRQITESRRAKFKTMARDEGREKAVAAMKKVLGK